MNKRIALRSVGLLFVLTATVLLVAVWYLRAHAISVCTPGADRWQATTASILDRKGWSSVIRRAQLDYLVSPLEGTDRFLVFQRAFRPNDSDVDLVFAPSSVADVLVVYRYNWHLSDWYCKMVIWTEA